MVTKNEVPKTHGEKGSKEPVCCQNATATEPPTLLKNTRQAFPPSEVKRPAEDPGGIKAAAAFELGPDQ